MVVLDTSKEVQVAKDIRKHAKGVLTRKVNQLKKSLVLNPGEKYDFSKLDKFSIATDAEKLEADLTNLNEKNELYATAARDVLNKNKVSEEVLDSFEDTVETYWYDSKKEASQLLALYKYEYKTALDIYLKNLAEDHKPSVTPFEPSAAEKQKAKKKADGDLNRQLNRWSLIKTEWECLLTQAENDVEVTKSLSSEELLKQSLLIDADQQKKSLEEHWENLKGFLDTLNELFQDGGIEPLEASRRIGFDAAGQVKRIQVVKTELGRVAVAIRQQNLNKKESDTGSVACTTPTVSTALKMDKIQTPKFTGKAEDFATWKDKFCSLVPRGRDKAETAILLEQAIPENKRYLLRGCGEDYELMLTVLQKELAPTRDVVNSINLQLSKLKRITAEDKDSDRKFVLLVETIEKMERDLVAIGRISALANCNTIQEIESKLPYLVKTDWYKRKREKTLDEKTDLEKFNDMMAFLKDYKYIAKDGVAEYERAKATNAKSYTALVTGQCLTISSKVNPANKKPAVSKPANSSGSNSFLYCLACQDGATDLSVAKHDTSTCDHWFSLSFPDRKKLLRCEYHPHTNTHNTSQCKYRKPRLPCKFCKVADHHSLFCPVHRASVNLNSSGTVFISELPSESKALQSKVLLPFLFANVSNPESSSKNSCVRLGTLTDNCATDIWITFEAANRLGLVGEDITISAGGFGGKQDLIQSKLYTVMLKTSRGVEAVECLGVEKIGSDELKPCTEKYAAMCHRFRVREKDVRRPVKVDMLIGQRGNHLHPDIIVKSIDGMKLLDGPLGKTFAGVDKSGTLGGSQLASSFLVSSLMNHPVIAVRADQIKDSFTVDTSFFLLILKCQIFLHRYFAKQVMSS